MDFTKKLILNQYTDFPKFLAGLSRFSKKTNLKVGDKVAFTNDFGIVFTNLTVIGFDESEDERFIFIDSDSWWFGCEPESLQKMSEFQLADNQTLYSENYEGFLEKEISNLEYNWQFSPPPIPMRTSDFQFSHNDYDGPEDNRCGCASSLAECFAQILEIEEELDD